MLNQPLHSLTLIVLVLNEEILLPDFLKKTVNDLDQGGLDWELILVNDGSTDSSLQIMEDFARDKERVIVLDLGGNFGPGANLHRAYQMASKTFAAYATVDGFYDTAELPRLMSYLNDADALSAYRTDLVAHPPLRRLQTMLNVYLQKLIFPRRFQFVAYHTLQIHRCDFLRRVKLEAKTPFLCSEMLFKAVECGLRVREVGIAYLPRKAGKATGGKFDLIARHLREVFKFWFKWFLKGDPIVEAGLSFAPLPRPAQPSADLARAAGE